MDFASLADELTTRTGEAFIQGSKHFSSPLSPIYGGTSIGLGRTVAMKYPYSARDRLESLDFVIDKDG